MTDSAPVAFGDQRQAIASRDRDPKVIDQSAYDTPPVTEGLQVHIAHGVRVAGPLVSHLHQPDARASPDALGATAGAGVGSPAARPP